MVKKKRKKKKPVKALSQLSARPVFARFGAGARVDPSGGPKKKKKTPKK